MAGRENEQEEKQRNLGARGGGGCQGPAIQLHDQHAVKVKARYTEVRKKWPEAKGRRDNLSSEKLVNYKAKLRLNIKN